MFPLDTRRLELVDLDLAIHRRLQRLVAAGVDRRPIGQRVGVDGVVDGREIDALLADFDPRGSERTVRDLESRIGEVPAATDRLDAFSRFSQLETELERIEEPLYATAMEIDHAIQLQIDQMRGK